MSNSPTQTKKRRYSTGDSRKTYYTKRQNTSRFDRNETDRYVPRTPEKVDNEPIIGRKRVGPPNYGPISKRVQHSNTNHRPILRQSVVPLDPRDHRDEAGNLAWVRQTWNDPDKLIEVWQDLEREREPRVRLMKEVERQLIREELTDVIGNNITTRAQISIDGGFWKMTTRRDVKDAREPDDEIEEDRNNDERDVAVWNTSRGDAEVDTIRDVKEWAATLERKDLLDKEKVLIQIVGSTGPCEACKVRLENMTRDVVDEWSRRLGIPKERLPRVELWSYYANSPKKPFYRDGFRIYNGWYNQDDPVMDRSWWINSRKTGDRAYIREHRMLTITPPPRTTDVTEGPSTTNVIQPPSTTNVVQPPLTTDVMRPQSVVLVPDRAKKDLVKKDD